MFVAASSRSFSNLPFEDVCNLVADLEFDKIEIWLNESGDGLRPSVVAADPEKQKENAYRVSKCLDPGILPKMPDPGIRHFLGNTMPNA